MKIEGIMKLIIKKENNNEEIELKEKRISNDEMIRMLYEEMNEMEKRNVEKVKRLEEKIEEIINGKDEIISKLEEMINQKMELIGNIIEEKNKEEEEMRMKINKIQDENLRIIDRLTLLEIEKDEIKKENKKMRENLEKIKKKIEEKKYLKIIQKI